MQKLTNENMSKFTILPADGWQKIASTGDSVNIQNISNARAQLQIVDAAPAASVDWGHILYPHSDIPTDATHDIYARAPHATIEIVVQKD